MWSSVGIGEMSSPRDGFLEKMALGEGVMETGESAGGAEVCSSDPVLC